MRWTRRGFLGSTAAAGLVGSKAAFAKADRPNVLVVYPDQLRAQSLSAYGERNIETKVFDELLADSVQFTSAYTPDPVCAPARAALLTGRMPHATGVLYNGLALSDEQPTVARVLRDSGYKTCFVGKWHLDDSKEHPGFVPKDRRGGFEDFIGYNVSHRYRRAVYYVGNRKKEVRPEPADRFEPEFQVDLALDWIEKARAPWFLQVAFGPPHPPGTAPIDDWSVDLPPGALDRVDPDAIAIPGNVPDFLLRPNRGAGGDGPQDRGVRYHLQGYYAAILAVEASIRRLLRGLDNLGLTRDTVVVFTSDHGEMGGAHGMYQKGEPYEEAVRVPLAFRWPGTLDPRRVDALASTTDVAPTILGLAGAPIPELAAHGDSLERWLRGNEGPNREEVLIQGKLARKDSWRMLRTRRYTYAEWHHTGRVALWDMKEDPLQLQDLGTSRDHADVRQDLSLRLAAQRARVDDRNRKPTRDGGPDGED